MWFHKWIKQAKEFNQMPSKEDMGATSKDNEKVIDLVGSHYFSNSGYAIQDEGVCSHPLLDERSEGEWVCYQCDIIVFGCKHSDGFTKINNNDYECLDCGLVDEGM